MCALACAVVILALAPATIRIGGQVLYGALMLVAALALILLVPAIYLLDLLDQRIFLRVRNRVRRVRGLTYVEEARRSDRHTEGEAYIREIADDGWCDECQRCHAHVYEL